MGMKIYKSLLVGALMAMPPNFALGTYVDSVVINQIALTGITAPGVGGTFTSFSAPTSDGDVNRSTGYNPFYFIATTSNGNSGVFVYYTYGQQFVDLVDTTTVAPTGGGNFASFSNLTSGLGVVGFIGYDTNGNQGVYGIGSVPLTLLATPSTITSLGTPLGTVLSTSISGNDYGIPGGTVYTATGPYSVSGTVPGSFGASVGPVSFKGSLGLTTNQKGIGTVVLASTDYSAGVQGVYSTNPTSPGHGTTDVANIGQAIPSGVGYFTSFGNPYATANEMTFTAHYTTTGSDDQQGVFVYGGYNSPGGGSPPIALTQIVATGQTAPNSRGATFTGFSSISDTSYDTTFLASLSDGNEGLYINYASNPGYLPLPEIVKVIETGDTLSGKTVAGISLASDASNYFDATNSGYTNTGIGFEVDFTDGSEGLYYFTVSLPEPGLLGLLALPALLLRRRK